MSKAEIVKQGAGIIQASVEDAVGQIYELVKADVEASAPATPIGGSEDAGSEAPLGYSQEQLDAKVSEAVASAKAEDQAKMESLQAELEEAKSDDESDDAKIAAQEEMLAKVRAIVAMPSEAPAVETPAAPADGGSVL